MYDKVKQILQKKNRLNISASVTQLCTKFRLLFHFFPQLSMLFFVVFFSGLDFVTIATLLLFRQNNFILWTAEVLQTFWHCVFFVLQATIMRSRLLSVFGEIQRHLQAWNRNYRLLSPLRWDTFGCKYCWCNVKEDGGKTDHFGTCGHGHSWRASNSLAQCLYTEHFRCKRGLFAGATISTSPIRQTRSPPENQELFLHSFAALWRCVLLGLSGPIPDAEASPRALHIPDVCSVSELSTCWGLSRCSCSCVYVKHSG